MGSRKVHDGIITDMTETERKLYAHIKRFFECYYGDSNFSEALISAPQNAAPLLENKGIEGVDPVQMLALISEQNQCHNIENEALIDAPQLKFWNRICEANRAERDVWLRFIRETPNKRFNKWHERQVVRCQSQLPHVTSKSLHHRIVAFELSKGCSLQCPFCALETESLKAWFAYTDENRLLWQSVLKAMVKYFGDAVGGGMCYWATDPSDNPDYIKFIQDYGEITGIYPQTTTAAATRNPDWTKALLEFRIEHSTSVDRFSLLSESMLHQLHEDYSAEELVHAELLHQYTDRGKSGMANAGRNRQHNEKKIESLKDHTPACVTGFLINMVEGTIRLIAPCPPTDKNPKGYRTFASGEFKTARELEFFIENTVANMHETARPEQILAIREDLDYIALENGFELKSTYKKYTFKGLQYMKVLGALINQGILTTSEIIDSVSKKHGNTMGVIQSIQQLFDLGLLMEDVDFQNKHL